MDLIKVSLVVSVFISLGLGFAVILNSKEKLNRLYFLNILTIIGWGAAMIYYRSSSPETILSWVKLLYLAASLIASNFLYFTYVFPKYAEVPVIKKIYIFVPNIVIAALCLFSDLIIAGAQVNWVGENTIYWGPIYPLYVVYILFYFNFAFFRLYRKRLAAVDKVERKQLGFVLLGYAASGFVSFTTNLILPTFGIFAFNWVGQVSTVLMVISATYAIIKHGLFNAKVIATELLVFIIWVIILGRTLVAQNPSDIIVGSITLILIFFVGVLLIRSVVKEVETRERIQKLAEDLEKANARLTDLDRQKSEFVSFATHQLRAPLTAMKGYSSLLLEGDMGKIPTKAKDGIQHIYDSANTLTHIVDDYLNVSRIELGAMKYNFETVNLKTLVEDVIAEIKPNIDKTGLTFTFEAQDTGLDYRITADRDKLKQVIANIVDNSVKYTPSGSITTTLTYDKPKHRFVFTVKDTGIGIDPAVLPHLFLKFSRAKGANKVNIKGTGLGLYVAKEIVEAHHGSIRAESAGEGKGSSFIVELEPWGKV